MFKTRSAILATAALTFLFLYQPIAVTAGEHPSDHPAGEQSAVTTETIADAIEKHVKNENKKDKGYFIVEDKEENNKLYLKLDRIHKERLSAIDKDQYFACVDFENKDGKTYDIDFFLKDTGMGLKVTETMVHKKEGKARYNWGKKGDFWVKKGVK
ncbi:MAG: hypothetical protein RQ824_09795 [bacterium]|nr:hypothetical protein [bacterium]